MDKLYLFLEIVVFFAVLLSLDLVLITSSSVPELQVLEEFPGVV